MDAMVVRIGMSLITMQIGMALKSSGPMKKHKVKKTFPWMRMHNEAHASVAEAQKTLREAREAVRKTRAARGYFAPKSMNGKGVSHASGSPSSPPSSSKRGRFKGGKSKGGPYTGSSGPCLVCNKLAQIVFHLGKSFSCGGSRENPTITASRARASSRVNQSPILLFNALAAQ